MLLFVYINADARFKLYSEAIYENNFLQDQPSDQSFVKFRDVGFRLNNEILPFLDLVYSFCPVVAAGFGFFFLLTETGGLASDGVIDLLAVGFFEE